MCVCDTHTRLMNLHCDSLRRLEEGTRRHKAEKNGCAATLHGTKFPRSLVYMYKYIANTITLIDKMATKYKLDNAPPTH